jgi:hypothetical protein
LLPEFPETKDGDFFKFDLHKILALQEDQDSLIKRSEVLYKAGIIDRATAKRLIGFETDPTDEMVYHPEGTPTIIPTQPVNPMGDAKSFKAIATNAMREEAKRGLAWREEFGRGGTNPGFARAKQISEGRELSDKDILDIYAFHSRHQVDKQAEGYNPGEDGYPSNGRIAIALWGGDPGFEWSKKEREKIMKDR